MPNEQTTVPLFVAAEVLTAADMNLSAGTGVPVFTNSTTRDAAFGGAGEKVLAEGQLCYLSSTNVVQYYDGAAWATVGPTTAGGLVFLTGGTFTTASSVSLTANTFSATYTNYQLNINITTGVDNVALSWRGRTSGTDNSNANYSFALAGRRYSDNAATTAGNGVTQTSARLSLMTSGGSNSVTATFFAPQLASRTSFVTQATGRGTSDPDSTLQGGGLFDAATQFDALSFFPASGTITGTYQVYGYAIA